MKLLLFLIRLYQLLISPFLGSCCRFVPSCSEYALEAIAKHGPWKGMFLTLRRLGRCHPFHPGGFDPPPLTQQEEEASSQGEEGPFPNH